MRFGNFLTVVGVAALALAAPTEKKKRVTKFKWFGVNESGAEVRLVSSPNYPERSDIESLFASFHPELLRTTLNSSSTVFLRLQY
jgi:hypothetical protein